ncbi:MAG: glycerophosphodiester phosphodiesterase family protein [Cytophagales bacterium]|nr:glycerophosphodiester phosphodiesterase family protein [Cytophagales bacterium]
MKIIFTLLIIFLFVPQAQTQIKIAGHRAGYYFNYPESSFQLMEFIESQFGRDTLMAEVDLRMSKSGTIYMMHDETVDRTTTGKGKVTDLIDSELNSLFLKLETGEITDQHIPTLEVLLKFIKHRKINLMLDIKTPIHAEVYALLKQHNMENRALTLTFNMELTRKVAALSNTVMLSALIVTEADWQQFNKVQLPQQKKVAYINSSTPTDVIEQLKKNHIKVMADVSEAQNSSGRPLDADGYLTKVKQQQLDILITDYPIEALSALSK